MRIDEVVLDRERLFKMKQQYDLGKKKKKVDTAIRQAQAKQSRLEEWMNARLNFIEHMPDKMFQLELRPVIRNFMGGLSPIEVLMYALTDKGSETFTKEQYQLSKEVATRNRDKIIQMLERQRTELDKLADEADQQEWPTPWKEVDENGRLSRFEAIEKVNTTMLKFFSRVRF
jgi:hypothetical protein